MNISTFSFIVMLLWALWWGIPSAGTGNSGPMNSCQTTMAGNPAAISADTLFTFENYPVGQSPAGWSEALTGRGKPCRWEVLNDHGNRVLAQVSAETPDYRFNIIVNDGLRYKDVSVSVRFKGVKGRGDQGGGPVWRYQDSDNYYVARANPLENNFRLYKVVNGSRHMLKSASLRIDTGKWYVLKIVMQGNKIQCYFNGKPELEATDNTFSNAGKVGLWTKSDAVTWFDNMQVTRLGSK